MKKKGMDNVIMGMLVFVASESIFFLLLVLAYVNFHKVTGAQAATLLEPVKTGIFSIALFASSFTIWLAEKAHEKQAIAQFKMWLFSTIALGTIFIAGQAEEYYRLIMDKITIDRDLFGTTFFTLTGFHGLHVIIGLLMLTLILGLSLWGRKHEPSEVGLQSVAIYWHFVDAVWVVVFSVVYLWRYVA